MESVSHDKDFMQMALYEAKKALGRTAPNPSVGAVIVKDGEVIASGYHKKAGTPHAEIHALRNAGYKAEGATLYVTLEPCCHTGKTPPCSVAVVESGIARVVIGMLDPNPLVDGGGVKYLQTHGVDVTTGVLSDECKSINEPFLKFISTRRPLIILKAGVSLDGKLSYAESKSGAITGLQSLQRAHQLRNIFDAILVGSATIKIDNPSLTTRIEDGSGRDPIRLILDSNLSSLSTSKVFNLESSAPTWLFCGKHVDIARVKQFEKKGVKVFSIETIKSGQLDLGEILDFLGKKGITSVLVEGGGAVHASFLKEQLVDKVCLFYAPIFAGENGRSLTGSYSTHGKSDAIKLSEVNYTRVGEDMMVEGNILYPN